MGLEMNPNTHLGWAALAAAFLGVGMLRQAPSKTARQLARLDKAEAAHVEKIASPEYHAALAKRERKRMKAMAR